ncbi:nSTAND1 domain-containing NTPase [Streptomyces sp. bgisy095]|uniref:nSTAND1 domain-containing NTPase n=1 Tax=unclassified Streptomyces TaxID=2593676 RepID=UPI003D744E8D
MTEERPAGAGGPESVIASAVVRIRGRDGTIAGAGFLVTGEWVLTCAHVVSDALDLPRDTAVDPGARVEVDLPLADGVPAAPAEVLHWVATRDDQSGDVAVLRLAGPLPGAFPLPMADARDVWDHETRTVGFPDDHPDGIWHGGRFRGPTGRGWVQLSRTDGQAVHVRPGFSGSPVWDDRLGAAVGLVVAAQPVREAQQAFVLRTGALAREVPALAAVLLPKSPFRGLAAFREADAGVFFGREDDVDRVVTALRGDRPAVTLYGPSGCGKSSLAFAGVVPRMREAGHDVLAVDSGRAGNLRAALATELSALAGASSADSLRTALAGASSADPPRTEPPSAVSPPTVDADRVEAWLGRLGLADAFHRATGRPAARLLVVLDQAEALLDLPDADLADALDLLFPPRPPAGPRILLTLRADCVDAALNHPRLGPALRRSATLPLTPMTRDQLHAVITRPLRDVPAVDYDPGLDRRVLDDAGGEPGVLPLLGFVLERLWERRDAGRLRASTYEETGGVTGALRHHAEEAWRECVRPEDEPEARRLLAGLVRVLPGGDVTLRRALARQEAGEERWTLARALAERRLLVLSGGDGHPESAELAHEALITVWPALADVVRVDADFLAARAETQHDLERWTDAGRPASLLPRSPHLAALEKRLHGREEELTAPQRVFLALARRRQRTRTRRTRAQWGAAALALALIAGLGTFLAQQSRVSAQREAEGRSRSLAVQSDGLTDSNPGQAALAALAAYEIAPTQEARNALLRRYTEVKDVTWILSGAEGMINGSLLGGDGADMSGDGAVTLVASDVGRATLFTRAEDGGVRQESFRLGTNVTSPVVSHDGRRVAYVRDGDGVVVWHEVTPRGKSLLGPAHPLEDPPGTADGNGARPHKLVDFSRDARFLVEAEAGSPTSPARVWDLETERPRDLANRITGIRSVKFGPDGDTLLVNGAGTGTELLLAFDVRADGARRLDEGMDADGSTVSSDGTTAVTCHPGETDATPPGKALYRAIRVADGRVLRTHRSGEALCAPVILDAAGDQFAVCEYNTWYVVDTHGTARPREFLAPSGMNRFDIAEGLPLLGSAKEPVVVAVNENSITGRRLASAGGKTAHGVPRLLGDGSTMLVRLGKKGESLGVVETEGDNRVLAEAAVGAGEPPAENQLIAVDGAETLMADAADGNRVTVRRLPSLERLADVTTAAPPVDDEGKPGPVHLALLPGDRLVTVAGPHVEQWDARTGRRLAPPIDLDALRLTTRDRPSYFVGPHHEPESLLVSVHEEPDLHVVDLRTGRERKELRIRFAEDFLTAYFLKDTRYLAVLTTGRMLELWSVEPGRPPRRVTGSLGPLRPQNWATGNPAGAEYFLAAGNSVTFMRADDPSRRDTYEFAENQRVLAASRDGRALLGSPQRGGSLSSVLGGQPLLLTRLDPALWKRHLCDVLGRDLTDAERIGLPGRLPDRTCPAR